VLGQRVVQIIFRTRFAYWPLITLSFSLSPGNAAAGGGVVDLAELALLAVANETACTTVGQMLLSSGSRSVHRRCRDLSWTWGQGIDIRAEDCEARAL
jgi:hypothetical protein